MTQKMNDDDLIVISGGAGFHLFPDPGPGQGSIIPPSVSPVPAPGGPGIPPESEGGGSGNQNLTK